MTYSMPDRFFLESARSRSGCGLKSGDRKSIRRLVPHPRAQWTVRWFPGRRGVGLL